MKTNTKKLVLTAMFTALAFVVAILIHFPVIPIAPFLKFDPKDVIIVIAGFIMGPIPAAIISCISALLEFFARNDSGVIGLAMNAIASVSFCCTAAVIYKKAHTIKGAVLGLIAGTLVMTILMLLWNYILTPIYSGISREAVLELFFPALIPFNLLKGIVNSALTMLLYKPLVMALRKARLVDSHTIATHIDENGEEVTESGERVEVVKKKKKKLTIGTILTALFVLVTCVLVLLIINKVI